MIWVTYNHFLDTSNSIYQHPWTGSMVWVACNSEKVKINIHAIKALLRRDVGDLDCVISKVPDICIKSLVLIFMGLSVNKDWEAI